MTTFYYWRCGVRRKLTAMTWARAIEKMYALRRQHGHDFSGCSWFHYYEKGERHWV